MTKISVRPIRRDEIGEFAATGTDPKRIDDVTQYVEQMMKQGSIHREWCFVAVQGNRWVGRIAYWTLPKSGKPHAPVLLDLPWEQEQYLSIGAQLLQETLPLMRELGADQIGYVVDTPPMPPQWQRFPQERMKLLDHIGFRVERVTDRFEWQGEKSGLPGTVKLHFRPLPEVGEAAFIEAIMRVSEQTLDRRIRDERQQEGAWTQARLMYMDMQHMTYDPSWWQLAYGKDGELIGLVMPAQNPTHPVIGYIGVVPEQRGRGYIDTLLNQGTVILHRGGADAIRADTDVENSPMARAFRRAGYIRFAKRYEYSLVLR